jgi:hypothetical protein
MRRCLPLLAALVTAGCGSGGPPVYPVTGVVQFRGGKPLAAGLVEFAPVDGGPAARGRLNADGTFTLSTDDRPGAVAGKHRVAVLPMVVADGAPASHRHKAVVVHPKHARFESSGLTATVEAGKTNHFTLEVDPAS